MPRFLLLFALLAALTGVAPAVAADTGMAVRTAAVSAPIARPLPFPRSGRSQAVWASAACWNDCQSYCTWGEAACLQTDAQGRCLTYTDRCDRFCQRDCRTRGGPLFAPLLELLD